jgi:hypothetical protein
LAIDDGLDQAGDRGANVGIVDLRELPHQFYGRALSSAMFQGWLLAGIVERKALEEVADVNPELTRDLEDPAGADPIRAGLVFLHLLVRYLQSLGKLFLGQSEFGAAGSNPFADVLIDAPRPAHVDPY